MSGNEKPEVTSDFSTCRRCGGIKVRKVAGSFDGRNKKYIDEHGSLWNGRICAGCHRHNVKNRLKQKRKEAKESNEKVL